MENKKKINQNLKLVSVLEDVLSFENRRVFKRLISSIDSMAGEVVRYHISQDNFPITSCINRTLH